MRFIYFIQDEKNVKFKIILNEIKMPKKSHNQPVNYDIVEVNEYPEEEDSEEEIQRPSKNRQSQKKQVKIKTKKYQPESEEDEDEEGEESESEEEQPRRKVKSEKHSSRNEVRKLPKGKVEVPVKTKIMSEARLRALAKGREIAKQKRIAKKNSDLEELKQKLWSEFEGGSKKGTQIEPREESVRSGERQPRSVIQESIDEVKKSMPKPRSSIYGEPIFVDFLNRKR
jgi:hypothetical protein